MVMIAAPTVDIEKMGQAAAASRHLATYSTNTKNATLLQIADLLERAWTLSWRPMPRIWPMAVLWMIRRLLLDRLLLTETRTACWLWTPAA